MVIKARIEGMVIEAMAAEETEEGRIVHSEASTDATRKEAVAGMAVEEAARTEGRRALIVVEAGEGEVEANKSRGKEIERREWPMCSRKRLRGRGMTMLVSRLDTLNPKTKRKRSWKGESRCWLTRKILACIAMACRDAVHYSDVMGIEC